MIQGFFREGRCEDALKLFGEMQDHKLSLNVMTISIVLEGLCRAHRIEEAFAVLHTMDDEGVVPDIVTYSILIEGLCNDGQIEKAKDLFNDLPSKGLQPGVVTLTILIGALCQEGLIQEAKDLLIQMYNPLWNEVVDAYPLLDEMKTRGFIVDATTFSLLFKHLQAGGRDCLLFYKVKKVVQRTSNLVLET